MLQQARMLMCGELGIPLESLLRECNLLRTSDACSSTCLPQSLGRTRLQYVFRGYWPVRQRQSVASCTLIFTVGNKMNADHMDWPAIGT